MPSDHLDEDWWALRLSDWYLCRRRRVCSARDLSADSARLVLYKRRFEAARRAVVGALSTQWGGRERNAAVLPNVLMWGLFLANRQSAIELHLGSERLRIGAVPAHSWIGVGVSEDTVRLDRILGGAEHAGEIGEGGGFRGG